MAKEAVAATCRRLQLFRQAIEQSQVTLFVATNRSNSVDEGTAFMGNIFDTSSVELTIGKSNTLG
jgi:hypothetical protein